jgi:hypothetical protein
VRDQGSTRHLVTPMLWMVAVCLAWFILATAVEAAIHV